MNRSVVTPVLVAVLGLASGGWLLQRGVDPQTNVYYQARLLEEVVDHVANQFVDVKDRDELYKMAIDGMLSELGDPHSAFMTPKDYENLRMMTRGEYGGLGIEIDIRDGWLTVLSPLPNSPAERVGLQPGDRIIRVEGESTRGWTTDKAVSVLRGPKGSPVKITVARMAIEEPIEFEITRADIELSAVPATYMLTDDVGYIELTGFSETATDSLRHAVDRLRDMGARSIVLDMRRNSGGLLEQGMSIADMFLDRRDLVVETRGRTPEQNQSFRAARNDEYPGLEVAILIGQRSASATEIVAGALQDHDRAVLIGQTTFGKGSVQTLYELPGRNILKLTTARWYTPSGRSIQKPYGIGSSALVVPDEEGGIELVPGDAPDAERKREDNAPIYHTEGGREVLGGGGITPDLLVADTLSTRERMLVEAIREEWPAFNNLIYRYAVEYARSRPEIQRGFPVTESMLDDFYQLVVSEGIGLDRAIYDEASSFVVRRLANEVSVVAFNREEGWKRLLADDPQVRTAVELLQAAAGTNQLFAMLPTYARSNGFTLGSEAQLELNGSAGSHPF